jgi:hypothetical protein
MSSATESTMNDSDTRHDMAREVARRQGLFSTTKRKLVAALVASFVLHLVAGAFLQHEAPEEKIVPLTAKFMKLPPPPAPVVVAAKPKPKPKPKPRPETNAAVASLPIPQVAESEKTAPAEEKVAETAVEPKPEPSPEPVVAKEEAKEPPKEEPKPSPPAEVAANLPPKKIQLGYTAFLGEQRTELGPVQLDFTHENGRYKLKINGRVKGLAAILYPGVFKGESEGLITADGLRPDRFIEERGSADKRREALFDHANKKVTIPEKDPLDIEGMAHDPLTWIVQFYFAMPKSEEATFSVVSTRRIDTYTMKRTGKDNIATPIGNVDVQIWRGSRKPRADGSGSGGSAQFWLAPEWHFIPFQIQVVSANGRSAYLELTAINTE